MKKIVLMASLGFALVTGTAVLVFAVQPMPAAACVLPNC
jgi:hypothetical protein